MVGHSLGGTIVRVFESMYRKDVAGVVLVEAAAENNFMFIDGRWVRWFSEAKPRQIPEVRDRITPDELSLNDAEKKATRTF